MRRAAKALACHVLRAKVSLSPPAPSPTAAALPTASYACNQTSAIQHSHINGTGSHGKGIDKLVETAVEADYGEGYCQTYSFIHSTDFFNNPVEGEFLQ